ncbi:PepSY-associated TM helix domain-containing protein [Luteimonas sp. MC1572]|uniref:PepSY-associated TM helix domain-containing protein n=1 Tax=Luteimonas sp. MC1572 TaxID=2799325 RepID=UPI0018F106D2|nr:PepSY-associated TM helix domain-containing protein [Luteimonas sp. MC1572]MBJ6982551.1 PepSY-associated TM helix domain-containing protein [Luteimonas sp. MC1572]QQO03803.1 PepSY-associated TM helix domain-containing protein [Luteimonas sp. MC1572]
MTAPAERSIAQAQRRGFWLRTLHQWHWISSAACLVGMLLFAVTGITLNHASSIEGSPTVDNRQVALPSTLLPLLATQEDGKAALPAGLAAWLGDELDMPVAGREAEWSADEVYLSLPGPGRDAWLAIDKTSGEVEYERTDRGWISYLNDLHKGRNAGPAWGWFIDVFAIACIVFTVTGLFLLQMHARQRPGTWPWVGLGLVVPVLLALLFIH